MLFRPKFFMISSSFHIAKTSRWRGSSSLTIFLLKKTSAILDIPYLLLMSFLSHATLLLLIRYILFDYVKHFFMVCHLFHSSFFVCSFIFSHFFLFFDFSSKKHLIHFIQAG
ncbi:hypothetical protein E2542_SST00289 [Spatholobus suberectus]|nr:hypothetical protein E2542_SST00289 [Spatholobus suberectus]